MRRSIMLATALAVALGTTAPAAAQEEPVQEQPEASGTSPAISLEWKRVQLPRAGAALWVTDILSIGGKFIAVGGGVRRSPTHLARVWTSPNGRKWTSVAMSRSARQGTPNAITQTPGGRFVMVGQGSCPIACAVTWRSPDGVKWKRIPQQFEQSVMHDVAALGDRLVAVGCHSPGFHCVAGRVWISEDDGASWQMQGDVPEIMFKAVSVVDGQLVAAGDTDGYDSAQGTLATSRDGVAWTIHGHSDGFGWMWAAGSHGGRALVGGGDHSPSGDKIAAVLLGSRDDGGFDPIEAKAFAKGFFVDMASSRNGLLLSGVRQIKRGIIPYAAVTADLATFTRVRFPKADQRTYGEAVAAAFSKNGARAVVGGRSGDKGAMWFSRVTQ
jgi:hypothetical protein